MSDEYDAFGRKKDEAGLGDLGWGSTGESDAPASPAPEATPNVTASPTPQTQFRTTPTRTGLEVKRRRPLVFLVQVIVLFGIGLGVFLAFDSGNDAANQARETIDRITGGNTGGSSNQSGSGEDDTVPEQVKSRDYFSAAGLRAGLKILESEQPGRISNFSFRRDRIDIQVVREGKTHIVQLTEDAEVPEVFSTSTAVGSDTFNYEEINAGAPERLMKAANARLNRSKADVDYFVAQKFTGSMVWGIYYKGGKPIAQGDSRGRYTRQIS
jgi:hypothetical protein